MRFVRRSPSNGSLSLAGKRGNVTKKKSTRRLIGSGSQKHRERSSDFMGYVPHVPLVRKHALNPINYRRPQLFIVKDLAPPIHSIPPNILSLAGKPGKPFGHTQSIPLINIKPSVNHSASHIRRFQMTHKPWSQKPEEQTTVIRTGTSENLVRRVWPLEKGPFPNPQNQKPVIRRLVSKDSAPPIPSGPPVTRTGTSENLFRRVYFLIKPPFPDPWNHDLVIGRHSFRNLFRRTQFPLITCVVPKPRNQKPVKRRRAIRRRIVKNSFRRVWSLIKPPFPDPWNHDLVIGRHSFRNLFRRTQFPLITCVVPKPRNQKPVKRRRAIRRRIVKNSFRPTQSILLIKRAVPKPRNQGPVRIRSHPVKNLYRPIQSSLIKRVVPNRPIQSILRKHLVQDSAPPSPREVFF